MLSTDLRSSNEGAGSQVPYDASGGKLGVTGVIVTLGLCWLSPTAWSAEPPGEKGRKSMDVVRYGDFGARGDGARR